MFASDFSAMSSAGSSGCFSPAAAAGGLLVLLLFALATRWSGSWRVFLSAPHAPTAKHQAPAAGNERQKSHRGQNEGRHRGISLFINRLIAVLGGLREAQFHPWIVMGGANIAPARDQLPASSDGACSNSRQDRTFRHAASQPLSALSICSYGHYRPAGWTVITKSRWLALSVLRRA